MPQNDLTIAEKIIVLREQPPTTSHRQLAEITGVPRTTLAWILQDRYKLEVEWSSQKEAKQGNSHKREKAKIQISKKLLASGSLLYLVTV